MTLAIQIVQFVLIISVLVILHELGHFIPAKYFKTKVEKFYLFFDVKFSLFKKKIGETVYGIGWLPLGGYVKIAGMIDESMDTEQMKEEPKPWEFRSKPAWQRLIIMLGGVTVNFFLAWIIYTLLLYSNGDTYIPADRIKYGIQVDSVGEKLGLRTGDKIVAVDGKKTKKFEDAMLDIILGDEVTVNRNGKELTFLIPEEGIAEVLGAKGKRFLGVRQVAIIDSLIPGKPALRAGIVPGDKVIAVNDGEVRYWDEFVDAVQGKANQDITLLVERQGVQKQIDLTVRKDSTIGVGPYIEDITTTDKFSLWGAIPAGFNETINVLIKQVKQFKIIAKPKTGAYKQVKGPIGIVELMSPTWDWTFFWGFMAMFSVWLAFLN
ncbi:MAG: RIP metalloprotease RseP, partial [Bacteroidota bacterium]